MSQYSAIMRRLSAPKFHAILMTLPRTERQGCFHRHRIKPNKTTGLPRAGQKNEQCIALLREVFQREDDEEMAEQVLRYWLLGKRRLLIAALDFLKIEHEDGLTNSSEVENIKEMSSNAIEALFKAIFEDGCQRETLMPEAKQELLDDILIYLRFMGVSEDKIKGLDKHEA